MATLFNTKISATYEGLLKTIDNAVISATLKELTDGSGNQSGLYLNTAGDFKVTSILEWGSLKDTGTGVTITQFVTAANGIENFNNDTTIPTSAAVKLYVDTKFSITDTLTEVLGFGNTTSGKDILVSANDDITFTDTSKILMGTGSDLSIFHDGANSFIKDTGTGDLYLEASTNFFVRNSDNGEVWIKGTDTGVSLRFQDSQKLITTNTGVDIAGNLVVTGTITGAGGSFLPLAGGTMTGNTIHNDNVKSIYGTSSDFEMFHNASSNANIIQSNLSRQLSLRQDNFVVLNQAANESMITAVLDGAVSLYFNNSKKLETTNTGATVTGALTTTTNVEVGANATFVDNGKAIFGVGGDLEIFHNGTASIIKDAGVGNLQINASNFVLNNSADDKNIITAIDGGAVNLFFDASKKIETVTDGAKVTGNLEVTGTITGSGGSFLPLAGGIMTGNTLHEDNVKSRYGNNGDLEIYHDGFNSYIQDTAGTGDLRIDTNAFRLRSANGGESMITAFQDSSVNLMFNTFTKLSTTNTGIAVTGNVVPTGSVIVPDAGQLQLGTGNDAQIYHDSSNFYAKNLVGQLNIDQAAITQSIVFTVSNSTALDKTALTINREGDLITGSSVTIAGDLTVNGTTTTVNTVTLSVKDPLIELAKDNAANSADIGFYGKYNDGTTRYLGLFNDASDSNKFRLFKGTTVEPTTTVNISGAGYVAADLVLAGLEASTGTFAGDVLVEDNLYLTDAGTVRAKIQLNSSDRDNLDIKAISLGSTMNFFTADTLALGLDASQNATFASTGTFAGRVGIGITASTNAMLDVQGPDTNNAVLARFFSNTGTRGSFIIRNGTSVSPTTFIGTAGGSEELSIGTDNAEALRINASNNATFVGTSSANVVVARDNMFVEAGQFYIGAAAANVDNSFRQAVSSGTFKLQKRISGTFTDVLAFDSSQNATFAGNVGIGSFPTSKLQLEQSIVPRITMIKTGVLSWYVGNPTQGSSTNFVIGTDSGSNFDILTLDTSGNANFSGNVGIGTSTPTAPLQVVGMAEHTDNAAAITAGLTVGAFYRTGDVLKVVH